MEATERVGITIFDLSRTFTAYLSYEFSFQPAALTTVPRPMPSCDAIVRQLSPRDRKRAKQFVASSKTMSALVIRVG